ncbi:MAG: hypothetical protein AB7L36_00710 [Sphingomonadaceae bacterium]
MIPRFSIIGTCIAERTWEAEGWTLQLFWLGIVFEITIARVDRRFS